jgi:cytochrome c551/c552
MKFFAAFLSLTTLGFAAKPDGAELFTTNCSACHMLDQMVVGPSLVEIRSIYNGKPDDFLKWCVKPEKKRPNVIEMPSMVHVGDEGLREIYVHIMKVADGVQAKAAKKGDPYVTSPVQAKRPQIQRIFMPDAGPAAVAVALDDSMSFCWDAGECRLRYSWNGGFIDGFPYWQGNGSSLAKVLGNIRYVEASSPFANAGEPKFFGYRIEKGLPVFKYQLGDRNITESFSAIANGGGFNRSFTMKPSSSTPVVLNFPTDQKVEYTSDKGKWVGSKLELTAAESTAFTINITFK